MVICIDAGNSSVKICAFGGRGNRGRVHRVNLAGNRRSWDSIMRSFGFKPQNIRGAIISSVVPNLTPSIAGAVRRLTGRAPLVVDAGMRFPFRISLPNPQTTGADRLCCAAGAIDKRRTGAILIDAGSAVTVDLVHKSVFRGGIIMAGPELSLRALAQHTKKLPLVTLLESASGRSMQFNTTEHSLLLGGRMSAAGGIREAVRFLERSAGGRPVKILTGGAAPAVSGLLPKSWRRDPHLTLKGLFRLYQLNSPE